jgi:hypothetical protein
MINSQECQICMINSEMLNSVAILNYKSKIYESTETRSSWRIIHFILKLKTTKSKKIISQNLQHLIFFELFNTLPSSIHISHGIESIS